MSAMEFENAAASIRRMKSMYPVRPELSGFVSGTKIATPTGFRRVERLGPGDLVVTNDGRQIEILWRGATRLLDAPPEARPVLFSRNALGEHDVLRLAPGTCVLVRGKDPGFVPARWLARMGIPGVRLASGRVRVSYHHLLLPCHAVLIAECAQVESFYPHKSCLDGLTPRLRRAVLDVLEHEDDTSERLHHYGVLAAPLLDDQTLEALGRHRRSLAPPPPVGRSRS